MRNSAISVCCGEGGDGGGIYLCSMCLDVCQHVFVLCFA